MGEMTQNVVLVLGYGNPARGDDGLGPALAEAIAALRLSGVSVDSDYQLTIEDAAAAAEHRYVIFVDADASGPEPFDFRAVQPDRSAASFSSHSVSPEAVLALARELPNAGAEGYVLAIRGYEFGAFQERLSEKAQANLERAVQFLAEALAEGDGAGLRRAASRAGQAESQAR
jgi:hydrogenase maturation protease